MSNSENNKLIVKNTLALYFRQIIILIVSLFTSRIVLQTLGVTDFGINNVVGGIVAMLSFITGSLAVTTQRFLSVELGNNDLIKLKQIFSNSLTLHLIFILFTILIAETIGLWFLNNKLVIPPERLYAAFWVYQFSIISFTVSVFSTPFEGALRAHENFSFYAKLSIFEVIFKLIAVYLLVFSTYDKLISAAFLFTSVTIICKLILFFYSNKKFDECKIKFSWFKDSIKSLLGYNVLTIINSIVAIIRHQGLNIILNFYYGPILNAAQGIANQIYTTLASFTNNAAITTQPQIIMSYTQNDRERLWNLIETSSRLFFYLFLIISLPFLLETHTVLFIWLGDYPEYTAVFTRLFLLENLLYVCMIPIMFANSAVGKLMPVTISNAICRLLILIFAIIIGMNKIAPEFIYISVIVFQSIHLIIYLIIVLKHQLQFSLLKYFSNVIIPIIKTIIPVILIPLIVHYYFSKTIFISCIIGIFSLLWSLALVFIIGLKSNEKQMIISKMPSFVRKLIKY